MAATRPGSNDAIGSDGTRFEQGSVPAVTTGRPPPR